MSAHPARFRSALAADAFCEALLLRLLLLRVVRAGVTVFVTGFATGRSTLGRAHGPVVRRGGVGSNDGGGGACAASQARTKLALCECHQPLAYGPLPKYFVVGVGALPSRSAALWLTFSSATITWRTSSGIAPRDTRSRERHCTAAACQKPILLMIVVLYIITSSPHLGW